MNQTGMQAEGSYATMQIPGGRLTPPAITSESSREILRATEALQDETLQSADLVKSVIDGKHYMDTGVFPRPANARE